MAGEDIYDEFDDQELKDRLKTLSLAALLKGSEEWQLVRQAADNIVERAIHQLVVKTKPTDVAKIAKLQAVIAQYKYDLFSEIEELANEGEAVFEECKTRGVKLGLFDYKKSESHP